MDCGKIAKNLVLHNGCNASKAGISKEIILMNFDDVDKTKSDLAGNVLAELIMKETSKAYKYESAKNSFEASSTLNKGAYANTFNHQILGRVLFKTQDVKDEMIKLTNSKVIAIVKNLDTTNSETVYEVYGWDSGLEMSDFQNASTDADGVFYTFTLASGDNAKEGQLPLSLYAGSLDETETMVKGLLAA